MKYDELILLVKSARSCGNNDIAIDRVIEAIEQMKPRRITPEEFGRVWERWRRGDSNEQIAEACGITVTRARTIARKLKRIYPYDRKVQS
jgi:hypothetical protein